MTNPELAVRSSGYGGRGYAIPVVNPDHPFKKVKGDKGYIKTRLAPDSDKALIVPSVTTVLKAAASPALTQWAVDQTAAYAAAYPESVLRRTEDRAFGFLRHYWTRKVAPLEEGFDVRNYHLGVLQDSSDLGTAIHEYIQADVDPRESFPSLEDKSDLFFQMVGAWDAWYASQFIEPIYTEGTVYSERWGYAGTFDCLWRVNGKLWLIDIKSARNMWPDHSRQLAALRSGDVMFAKKPDGEWEEINWQPIVHEVDHFGFLQVRPEDVSTKGEYMEPFVKLHEAKDLDLHFTAFRACLELKRAEIALALREKEAA
jgi:hypothetical protein